MEYKICSRCRRRRRINNFYFRRDKKRYCAQCKDCTKKRLRIYDRKYNKRSEIKAKKKLQQKLYKQRPYVIEQRKKQVKKYQKKLKYKNYKKEYNQKLKVRVAHNLRERLRGVLKEYKNLQSIPTLIGCSINYLIQYLESQFDDEMSWNNYGQWHLDHKIPCVSFDLSKVEEQKKCFNYTNLQPLWAFDNISKGAKV